MKKAYLYKNIFYIIVKKTKAFKSLEENVKDPCKLCDIRLEKGCEKMEGLRKRIEKKRLLCGYDFFIKVLKKRNRF